MLPQMEVIMRARREGTETLGSGLYLARRSAAGEVARGRVVVTR
jgi:hypothetical protein